MHLINICKINLTINKTKQTNRWGQLTHLVNNGNENSIKAIAVFSMKAHGNENSNSMNGMIGIYISKQANANLILIEYLVIQGR